MWGTIIDIAVIAIIIIFTLIGIAKGLIDSVLSLVGTGLAAVGGVFLSKYVGNWVNKIFDLENVILGKLDGGANGTVEFFNGKFNLSNIEVAKFAVWVITVAALFILIKLVIFILAKIFEGVAKTSPTITGINRVLGMFFGLIKGALIVFAGLAICSMLGQVPVIGTTINQKINETKVTKFADKYVDRFVESNLTKENIQGFIQKIAFEAVPTLEGDTTNDTTTGDTTTDTPASDTTPETPETPAETPETPAE